MPLQQWFAGRRLYFTVRSLGSSTAATLRDAVRFATHHSRRRRVSAAAALTCALLAILLLARRARVVAPTRVSSVSTKLSIRKSRAGAGTPPVMKAGETNADEGDDEGAAATKGAAASKPPHVVIYRMLGNDIWPLQVRRGAMRVCVCASRALFFNRLAGVHTVVAASFDDPTHTPHRHRTSTHPSVSVSSDHGHEKLFTQGIGQMRDNTLFALKREREFIDDLRAKNELEVFWVVNRIINTTERRLLVTDLKTAGVNVLYVYPPLAMVHCLQSSDASSATTEMLVYAQAQNAVRNAMMRHAKRIKAQWVFPLDGNQFLPAPFYTTLRARLTVAEASGFSAMLVPMFRQVLQPNGMVIDQSSTTSDIVREQFLGRDTFEVSEPQIAIRVNAYIGESDAMDGLAFDERRAYGKRNKAIFVRDLCVRKDETMCCHIIETPDKPLRAYTGGENTLMDMHLNTGYDDNVVLSCIAP